MAGELGIPGLTGAEEIGRGGTGVVYRARHDASERTVAIKVLDQILLDDVGAARFRHDFVNIADATDDESVVTVLAVGVLPVGHPYLVLEYVDGGSLGSVLMSGLLEAQVAARVLAETCAAVDRIHAAGMVHGDITPNNVLLTREGSVRLSGFGLVEHFSGGSQPLALAVSPAHSAPEVLAGRKRTPASDIWALGSVLLDAVSHTSPLGPAAAPTADLVAGALDGRAPDYSAAPSSLHAVLDAALAREPSMRCSAAQMAVSLKAVYEQPQVVEPFSPADSAIAISTTLSGDYRPIPKSPGIFSDAPPPPARRRVLGVVAALLIVFGIFVAAVATRPSDQVVDQVATGPLAPEGEDNGGAIASTADDASIEETRPTRSVESSTTTTQAPRSTTSARAPEPSATTIAATTTTSTTEDLTATGETTTTVDPDASTTTDPDASTTTIDPEASTTTVDLDASTTTTDPDASTTTSSTIATSTSTSTTVVETTTTTSQPTTSTTTATTTTSTTVAATTTSTTAASTTTTTAGG